MNQSNSPRQANPPTNQIDQLNPQLLEAAFRILLLKIVEELPPEAQHAIFHGERGDANEQSILQHLHNHQFAKHKKLFDAALPGKQQPAPAPPKNQPQPTRGKLRPFSTATAQTRQIFGGNSDAF